MRLSHTLAVVLAIAVAGCEVTVKNGNESASNTIEPTAAAEVQDDSNPESIARARELALRFGNDQQRAALRRQARQEMEGLRFEVDISNRKLRMFRGDRLVEEHDVAVGSEKWPTPTGSWEFHRVDINPEWNPPKSEEWAEDETRKAPGDPENPMGRARLVYRMPNTVHGTDDLDSLGKAVSHGSIRVANEVALSLAEALLKAGEAWEGQEWFRQMTRNRDKEFQVPLENRIPIKVQE